MPLKIKHIFRTDLDPNSNNWWSKDKIDKLNLNFSLLSNGGMPGPAGTIGVDGNFGLDGAQGPQGHEGPQGDVGATGAQGISPWTEGSNAKYLTLFPNFQRIEGNDDENYPLRVGIGQLNNEQSAINYQGPLHILHNHDSNISNLIINSPDSLDFHFRLSPISGSDSSPKKIEIGNLDGDSNLILEYDLDTMDYKLHSMLDSVNYLLELNQFNLILRSEKSILGINDTNIITANKNFIYKPEAVEDKILVSLDGDGNAAWKNKVDVFGSFPVGAVISITPEQFNDNNFHLNYTENVDPTQKLNIIYGKGRENTPFEGWYLANGQTWTDRVNQYDTPNLNSFDFNVDSNGDGQDEIDGGDNNKIIIGGGDFNMNATYINGEYDIQLIDNNIINITDDTVNFNTGNEFYQSRQIHIVYLKNLNYFWQTGDAETIPTTSIVLSIASNTVNGACAESRATYLWTGGNTDWVNGNMTGISLYKVDLSPATRGWYSQNGIARYWNGNRFISRASCAITYNVNLATNSDVTQLNGTLPLSLNNYTIDTPAFEHATVILSEDSNAPAGWYRETNNTYGWRRYWSGTQFLGESFELPYIFKAGVIGASTSNNSNACLSAESIAIYYITGNSGPNGITELHKINNVGGKVLVHLNWDDGDADGTKPLVEIYTQNAPSIGAPYKSLTDMTTSNIIYRSTITTTSNLNKPIECDDDGYTINGTTTIDNLDSSDSGPVSGTITVTKAPVILELTAFGGAGFNKICKTDGEIDITGVGIYKVLADGYQTKTKSITITKNGTFNYTLSGTFGCNSGNKVTIS